MTRLLCFFTLVTLLSCKALKNIKKDKLVKPDTAIIINTNIVPSQKKEAQNNKTKEKETQEISSVPDTGQPKPTDYNKPPTNNPKKSLDMNFNSLDIASLVVSFISLIVAVIALAISRNYTKASIGTPIVIQGLNELSEYYHSWTKPHTANEEIEYIITTIMLIRKKQVILKQAGFLAEYEKYDQAAKLFTGTCTELQNTGGQLSKEQKDKLINATKNVTDAYDSLLSKIDSRLNEIFKNPFSKKLFS